MSTTRHSAIGAGDDNDPNPSVGGRKSEVSKKAKQYLKDIKKPNMYIAIYYPRLYKEYRLPVNFNVLISEDKYRAFKK